MVEIIAARRFALIVKTTQQRQIFGNLVHVVHAAARHRAKLTLPDETLPEIRKQREVVSTKKAGKLQLLVTAELPNIV